jgi:hypothetical protein
MHYKGVCFYTTFAIYEVVTAFSLLVIILYYSSRENPNIKTLTVMGVVPWIYLWDNSRPSELSIVNSYPQREQA